MPRVRLVVGMNVGGESRDAGTVCDVPGDVASSLLKLGRVEIVRGDQPDTPERTVTPERARRTKETR